MPHWSFADVGYDTSRKEWFVAFQDSAGQSQGTIYGPRIEFRKVSARQYEWPENHGSGWHVRERFFFGEVEEIAQDENGTLTLIGTRPPRESLPVLPDFDYLEYAWHLKTALGFLEYFKNGRLVGKVDNRILAVESLTHRTVGSFPTIRMRAERDEVESVVITQTCAVIVGRLG